MFSLNFAEVDSRSRLLPSLLLFLLFSLVAGCQEMEPPSVLVDFDPSNPPRMLNEWGLFKLDNDQLSINESSVPYDLNTPLFSDYASKFRTLWVPPGNSIALDKSQNLHFPDGTIVTKTFYYSVANDSSSLTNVTLQLDTSQGESISLVENRIVETRLLVKKANVWYALPYVWNKTQNNAILAREGDFVELTIEHGSQYTDFSYSVPDVNQCAGCHAENHTTGLLKPIGLKLRHLNKEYRYSDQSLNQLDYMASRGYLDGLAEVSKIPRNANWSNSLHRERFSRLTTDSSNSSEPLWQKTQLDKIARSYLDINCGHCHNPTGAADTSGLHLNIENTSQWALGICKPPIAAGRGSGGRSYSIVPGDAARSIIVYRMHSDDPAVMMPELGRSLIHQQGVTLLSAWINTMDGRCG